MIQQEEQPTSTPTSTPSSSSSSSSSSSLSSSSSSSSSNKRIIFIRHGRTYMNEYLSQPGSRWGDAGFTDIGLPSHLYRDSPLSEKGIEQANALCCQLSNEKKNNKEEEEEEEEQAQEQGGGGGLLDEIDLVVLSPLTRSFQTFEYGILPHLLTKEEKKNEEQQQKRKQKQQMEQGQKTVTKPIILPQHISVPVVSLPLASERVYLMSDLGLSVNELELKFPYVDYTTEFDKFEKEWWFTVKKNDDTGTISKQKNDNDDDDDDDDDDNDNDNNNTTNATIYTFNSKHESEYKEWRPNTEGQTYSCYGEPDEEFQQRMVALYQWLYQCDKCTICVVSHWGVLDFLTGIDFDNCELKTVSFEDIRNHLESKSML